MLGSVAQWLEQGTHNPLVVGSNPTGPTRLRRFPFASRLSILRARPGIGCPVWGDDRGALGGGVGTLAGGVLRARPCGVRRC